MLSQEQGIGMGFIARTAVEGVDREAIEQDVRVLTRIWDKVLAKKANAACPDIVYEELPLHIRVVRDLTDPDVETIRIDHRDTYERVRKFVDEFIPDFSERMQFLKELHERDIWRRDMHVGVEYFSNAEFETHTFLNMMENPMATLCFQGLYDIYSSYEIRCIPHIIHGGDPNVSDEMNEIIKFPFMLMSLFHGDPPEQIYEMPMVIYYHVEEFDNGMEKYGSRVVKNIRRKMQQFFA